MSTVIEVAEPQYTSDIHVYPFDFTDSLLSGVTVSSAVVTYEGLLAAQGSGSAAGTAVSSPIVNGTFGTVATAGTYYFDCQATLSNSEKDTIRLIVHRPER